MSDPFAPGTRVRYEPGPATLAVLRKPRSLGPPPVSIPGDIGTVVEVAGSQIAVQWDTGREATVDPDDLEVMEDRPNDARELPRPTERRVRSWMWVNVQDYVGAGHEVDRTKLAEDAAEEFDLYVGPEDEIPEEVFELSGEVADAYERAPEPAAAGELAPTARRMDNAARWMWDHVADYDRRRSGVDAKGMADDAADAFQLYAPPDYQTLDQVRDLARRVSASFARGDAGPYELNEEED